MENAHYIILALIKNLDEGDGAALPMIDYHFFRILDTKGIVTSIKNNLELLTEIKHLQTEGYVVVNQYNNFVITSEGKEWLKNNSISSS